MLEGTAKLWEIHGPIPNQVEQSTAIDGVNGAETAQETLVFRYGSVVQTTSESSADRLKVDRTAESNRIHIFGNDSDPNSSDFQSIL